MELSYNSNLLLYDYILRFKASILLQTKYNRNIQYRYRVCIMKEISNGIQFDKLMSIWMVIWFLLYELNIIRITPKLSFVFGFLGNIIAFLFMSFTGMLTFIKMIQLFYIFLIIKAFPLYMVWNTNMFTKESFYATVIMVVIYFLWLEYNNTNLFEVYINTLNQLRDK